MKLLTTAEVAQKFGVSRQCVYQWKAEGRIKPAVETARLTLYPANVRKPRELPRGPKALTKRRGKS